VINPNRQTLNIGKIRLAGSSKSPFRLNIDGKPSREADDIYIPGGDSIFIFVEVTVDPTNVNNPLVIRDSVVFHTNGNVQDVKLIAFGQDVHFFDGEMLKTQHWKNDKPYLIYNSVAVDTLHKLTIDEGCRIHFHVGSSLFVIGTLEVNGTFNKPVIFQGDRLEKDYEDVPGQWGAYRTDKEGNVTYIYGGIHLLQGSRDNRINFAVIKNGIKGLEADSLGSSQNPMLVLSNTRIENMTAFCLYTHTSNIVASNCIFANSGSYNLALRFGGSYEFNHCTAINTSSKEIRGSTTVLLLQNYFINNKVAYVYDQIKADFNNCIIYGDNDNELVFDYAGQGLFNYRFKNSLIKTPLKLNDPKYPGAVFNKDPRFKLPGKDGFRFAIDSLSPARGIADLNIAKLFPVDLRNNSRLSDEGPDAGAVEWVPAKK
jgi:hypothetical protein